MTYSDDWNDDMVLLDDDTAERLLRGAVAPDDAPPGYAEVAALLGELRDEPVVIDDRQVWAVTTAVQSGVAARTRVRSARRARRRLPAAIAGGVVIAMFVAPVAARIARDIDLVPVMGDDGGDRGAVVVPPANGDAATNGSGSSGASRASTAKQHSKAPTTPAADRAAVTVPVASDAPAQPETPSTPDTSGTTDPSAPAGAADGTAPGGEQQPCDRGAEAAVKADGACPGEQRPVEEPSDEKPRGREGR